MDEYKKELKKLNDMLAKHRGQKGFTVIEGAIAVVIVCILIAIVVGGAKENADRRKEVTSITGEIERIEYVGGGDASNKTAIYWKNGTTTLMDGYIENQVPKGVRAKIVWNDDKQKYFIVPDGPFPAEVPR
jgi:prepilin-type N-terminal cleavage/methylation domain-containing protein